MYLALWTVAIVLSVAGTIGGQLRWNGVRYVKTAATVGFLALSVRAAVLGYHPELSIAFSVSLAVATLADYLLGKPDNSDVFQAGLTAFLVAYLIYGVDLIVAVPPTGRPWQIVVGAAVAVFLLSGLQYHTLTQLPSDLKIPVILYITVISLFLFAGAVYVLYPVFGPRTWTAHFTAITVGVLSIYISDSLIAHNLFRAPIPCDELFVMPTYYVGQASMVLALYLL